jgi:hypothetical protein
MEDKKEESTGFGGGWNYRIIFHPPSILKREGKFDVPIGAYYGIHEVYYDKDGTQTAYTKDCLVAGDDILNNDNKQEHKEAIESIESILKYMLQSLDRPILQLEDFHISDEENA